MHVGPFCRTTKQFVAIWTSLLHYEPACSMLDEQQQITIDLHLDIYELISVRAGVTNITELYIFYTNLNDPDPNSAL